MHRQHIVALVTQQTASTVRVRYWNKGLEAFNEGKKRRNMEHIVLILGPEDTSPKLIQRAQDRLLSLAAEHNNRVRQAGIAYEKTLRNMKL